MKKTTEKQFFLRIVWLPLSLLLVFSSLSCGFNIRCLTNPATWFWGLVITGPVIASYMPMIVIFTRKMKHQNTPAIKKALMVLPIKYVIYFTTISLPIILLLDSNIELIDEPELPIPLFEKALNIVNLIAWSAIIVCIISYLFIGLFFLLATLLKRMRIIEPNI